MWRLQKSKAATPPMFWIAVKSPSLAPLGWPKSVASQLANLGPQAAVLHSCHGTMVCRPLSSEPS